MTVAILLALAVLLGIACAALSWTHVLRVQAAVGPDPSALTVALKRLPAAARLDELARRADPKSFAHALAEDLLAADGDAAKIAATDAALADVDHALRTGTGWATAGVRIAILGDVLLALVTKLTTDSTRWAFADAAVGAVAALVCMEAGRRAESVSAAHRIAIDDLVEVVLADVVQTTANGPRRRSHGASRNPARARPRRA